MAFTSLVPGLREFTFLYKIGDFFKRMLTSPWFYVVLAFIAIAFGTFHYLKTDKAEAVEQATVTAIEQADTKATAQTQETRSEIATADQEIQADAARRRVQTAKDYEYVRGRIEAAPEDQRKGQADPLLIDTINELDRLRANRDGRPTTGPSPVRQP